MAAGTYWIKIEEGSAATAWVAAVADRSVTVPTSGDISVTAYDYAIGTEPNGLGSGPSGLGETNVKTLDATTKTVANGATTLVLPIDYTPTGPLAQGPDGSWYLITGYHTLKFRLAT